MNGFRTLTYFLKIKNHSLLSGSSRSVFSKDVNTSSVRLLSSEVTQTNEEKPQHNPVLKDEEFDLKDYGPGITRRFNFADYADKSPLIQKYIDTGVNLFEIQKKPSEANFLLTLRIEKVESYLTFLTENGVPESDIGTLITKNPALLREDFDDLEVRINYLKSKKFDKEMISRIITGNPKWLSTPVKEIDDILGLLQRTLYLKGDQVRHIITHAPRLATKKKSLIMMNIHALKEEMNLDKHSLKRVVLSEPRLLYISSFDLIATFDYITKVMQVSTSLVVSQPKALTCARLVLKERHKFLVSLGRAQFSQFLPGYVSLLSLTQMSDVEFCEKIAKTSVKLFYDFLKTF